MKFLIFGGSGFIGSYLTKYINKNGGEAVPASRSGGENGIAVDICDEKSFGAINFQPDVIVNCASIVPQKGKSSKDPEFLKELFLTNTVGAVNIANWAVKNKISQIINCSTLVVVKKPWPNPLKEEYEALPGGAHAGYCMSKLSQEQLMDECVANGDVKLTHVRLSAVYGEEMVPEGIIFNILKKLMKNEEVQLIDAEKNTVDFINVEDVCRGIYAIGRSTSQYNRINLASGEPVSIYNLAVQLKELTHSDSPIVNSVSSEVGSEANIDISRLQQVIGSTYNSFIPLKEGLDNVVSKFKREN
ncbi:NAD-dependent epimerase/dehydratase family protein [Autumnicola musiva]|uniref:NAD(P)-dependent oxidoreductase n=1 Tax=Autumnicola musiva TaxID=3075589 RepID=A0ABU3D8Y7_9FLAO|nr:NAD(P)-dependent oxidoreductase [Zunongwangia sp. F117]MDT0677478.1 NAD(P)-dependent oxidoreductase [Zunongwangia sp. F117]